MFAFLHGKGRVDWDTPVHEPALASEYWLVECRDRITRADQVVRKALRERCYGPDVLLEVMVALGTAPPADDEVPVIPGRTS